MKQKLNSILLVDDNPADNYFHTLVIENAKITETIHIAENGLEALESITSKIDGVHPQPNIIFSDINMPKMNGWEFLEEYEKLSERQKSKCVVMMLSTSTNEGDIKKANKYNHVNGFSSKPLTKEILSETVEKHFNDIL